MVFKSTIWLSISFFTNKILLIFWQLYLARFFAESPEQYGYYRLLVSQYGVWIFIAEASLIYAVQQFLAENKDQLENRIRDFWPFIVGARIVTGLAAGIIFTLIIWLKYPLLIIPAVILSLSMIIFSISTAPLGLWAGVGDFRQEAKAGLLSTPVFISTAFAVTLFTNDITIIIVCTLISSSVEGLYLWIKAVKRWGLPVRISAAVKVYGMKFLRFCFPLTVSSFAFRFFFWGDMIVITDNIGPAFAGIYSISLMLFLIIVTATWGQFGKAYTPKLISSWSSGTAEIKYQLQMILNVFALIGIFGLTIAGLFGNWMFSFLFTENSTWVNASGPFFWLLAGFIPTVLYNLIYRLLLLEKGTFLYMVYSIIIVVVKFSIVYLFSEKLGLNGIAFTSSFLMLLFYILLAIPLSSEAKKLFLNTKMLLKYLVPVLLIVSIVWLKDSDLINSGVFYILSLSVLVLSTLANYSGIAFFYKNIQNAFALKG